MKTAIGLHLGRFFIERGLYANLTGDEQFVP